MLSKISTTATVLLCRHLWRSSRPTCFASNTSGIVNYCRQRKAYYSSVSAVDQNLNDQQDSSPEQPSESAMESFPITLHPSLMKALKNTFGYDTPTPIQAKTLALPSPMPRDVFLQARTGSGKTLAFLIPAMNYILSEIPDTELKHGSGLVRVFIVSPTRELAQQIAVEAEKLVSNHKRSLRVLCAVGGTSRRDQWRQISVGRCEIVVGTPGRLVDLLGESEFSERVQQGLKFLVLDEADTLLDMGFRDELKQILERLPSERRSLMLSATVTSQIRQIAKETLSPEHDFISCVDDDAQANGGQMGRIPDTIRQRWIPLSAGTHVSFLSKIFLQHQHETKGKGKIMVFLPTTKTTQLYSQAFRRLADTYASKFVEESQVKSTSRFSRTNRGSRDQDKPWSVFELHSGLTQSRRTNTADIFRHHGSEKYGRYSKPQIPILFTSDVSARGVDYPGVTMVVQLGIPPSTENYIHRIGRTGRAGKQGEGVLIAAMGWEEPAIKAFKLRELGIKRWNLEEEPVPVNITGGEEALQEWVKSTLELVDGELIEDAFKSLVGYCKLYFSHYLSHNDMGRCITDGLY